MSVRRDPDAILATWLEEGPTRLPDATKRAIAVNTRTTRQSRRPRWVPWRFPIMNGATRYVVAAVAVLAIAVGGLYVLNPSGGNVGGPAPSPSPSTSPSASPGPSGSTPPALTQTFTSDLYGISIDYPSGWIPTAATVPWTSGLAGTVEGARDLLWDPVLNDHLFLSLASQPLAGKTGDQWAAAISSLPDWGGACAPEDTRPITVDGAPGVIVECASRPTYALTWAGDRGYLVVLYRSGDEPWLDGVYDRAWFEQVVATVQLSPEDAVAPSAAPSSDPSSNPTPSPS
jgi:hypothetical protein